MLQGDDKCWLSLAHPRLLIDGNAVAGPINFRAAYDAHKNMFLILQDGQVGACEAVVLSGEFRVRIEERGDRSISALPALFVEDMEPIPDRHYSQADKSACLLSPLEEGDFLNPDFSIKVFIDRLVIPFLYGQVFYSLHQRWPWSEYSHGVTGLLESYAALGDPSHVQQCLDQLSRDLRAWRRIRALLLQRHCIRGHVQCSCNRRGHFRRCHPNAFRGMQLLQDDVRRMGIRVD